MTYEPNEVFGEFGGGGFAYEPEGALELHVPASFPSFPDVLLDAKRNAKVCDFGSSKSMEKSRDMTVGVGTVAYMAPEQMRAFSDSSINIMTADGTKFDVFSFAMLALFVATAQAPYRGLDNNKIFIKVGMLGDRTAIPSGYACASSENKEDNFGDFVKLVKQMWHENPEDRPPFAIIVNQLCQLFFRIKKPDSVGAF